MNFFQKKKIFQCWIFLGIFGSQQFLWAYLPSPAVFLSQWEAIVLKKQAHKLVGLKEKGIVFRVQVFRGFSEQEWQRPDLVPLLEEGWHLDFKNQILKMGMMGKEGGEGLGVTKMPFSHFLPVWTLFWRGGEAAEKPLFATFLETVKPLRLKRYGSSRTEFWVAVELRSESSGVILGLDSKTSFPLSWEDEQGHWKIRWRTQPPQEGEEPTSWPWEVFLQTRASEVWKWRFEPWGGGSTTFFRSKRELPELWGDSVKAARRWVGKVLGG